ncbi:hypothetical protein SAMN05216167_112175 [Spirosoma endophyticum]|uniref:Uncharacterized protein n=1 Tax=Spirosoma endophyticum TaxID=662367 RepID=A0A1I1ZNQ0_9BACT|nr:hypothetical protein SAMN05216167_112175 [Spirosoma endophyticum]
MIIFPPVARHFSRCFLGFLLSSLAKQLLAQTIIYVRPDDSRMTRYRTCWAQAFDKTQLQAAIDNALKTGANQV